jgi:hypothetical protein
MRIIDINLTNLPKFICRLPEQKSWGFDSGSKGRPEACEKAEAESNFCLCKITDDWSFESLRTRPPSESPKGLGEQPSVYKLRLDGTTVTARTGAAIRTTTENHLSRRARIPITAV